MDVHSKVHTFVFSRNRIGVVSLEMQILVFSASNDTRCQFTMFPPNHQVIIPKYIMYCCYNQTHDFKFLLLISILVNREKIIMLIR